MTVETIDLPSNIDPYRLAKRQARFEGAVDLAKFTRLTPMLANSDSRCHIDLVFSLDAKAHCLMQGRIHGRLELVCQRCLKPFEWLFELPIKLAMVKSEPDEGQLPQGFEAIPLEGEQINLSDAIEDELLLSVPNYPLHEELCQPAAKKG